MNVFKATAVISALLLLWACSQEQPWHLKSIAGIMPPLEFTLTGANGKTVNAEDFEGKIKLLYFGYTHCPDVCPTTLATLSQALHKLDKSAEQVRVLFVSVDPQRDTPTLLNQYARAFGPEFVGLTGNQAALQALTKRYRVTYGYGKKDANGNYEVAHSSAVFIFDRQGEARLLATDVSHTDDVVADLKRLLSES